MTPSIIVAGYINTDVVALGIRQFVEPGEHVLGEELHIGPGGKSRNIANMIAKLMDSGNVAMIGRTARDPFNLWKVPIEALQEAGVNTDHISFARDDSGEWPSVALIPVNKEGQNEIFLVPGAGQGFSPADIDAAEDLFKITSQHNGLFVLTLECPLPTARHAIHKAKNLGLRVVLDPGGIDSSMALEDLLSAGLYLIKPNEHEAKVLTGVDPVDFRSARLVAKKLRAKGVENILLTAGAEGAYLFTADDELHIPIPRVHTSGQDYDATGCGDQAMAALCASLQAGEPVESAARRAVLAGTLQFHRRGIQPLSRDDLSATITSKNRSEDL